MRCSAVSGSRAEGSHGAGAGGKTRIASRERLRFSGLGTSVAAGAMVTAPGAAWLGALAACGAGDAGVICASGFPGAAGFGSAGAASAAGGQTLTGLTTLPARVGCSSSFFSGKGGDLLCVCDGASNTSTVGAKRGDGAGGLGVDSCKPCKTHRKPRCSNSTSVILTPRNSPRVFKCASCARGEKPGQGLNLHRRKKALPCPGRQCKGDR